MVEVALKRYRQLETIGSGTYGVIYKALDTQSGELVALKKMIDCSDNEDFIREVGILKKLNHPNVISLDHIIFRPTYYLIFELMKMDLKKVLRAGPCPKKIMRKYLKQLLCGLAHCHQANIYHLDLKPENILLSKDTLKIADFGAAHIATLPACKDTITLGTLWYRSPEILLGASPFAASTDLWAAGCIFAEMATGKPLFPGDCDIHQLYTIFQKLGTPTENTWSGVTKYPHYDKKFPKWPAQKQLIPPSAVCPNGRDLLQKMLSYDPTKRISAQEALLHPYFGTKTKQRS